MNDPEDRPERALALSYAPAVARDGLAALFALDDRLGAIVRATREPTIGLMRLTWWADALERLDAAPPPAEPVLTAIALTVVPHGVTGAALAGMVDGWERLLDRDRFDAKAFAVERGGRLFAAAAAVIGATDERVEILGAGWALAGLVGDWRMADATVSAGEYLDKALTKPWPHALRSLGAMGLTARFDLNGTDAPGSPRRVARLLLHRLTGR